MSDEQHIGNDKSRYLNTPKRTDVGHRSGLANLKSPPRIKKLFTLHNGRKLEAEHVTVAAENVATETAVHPMNPRNQEALTTNAVRDILQQIESRGVDTEGVAVKRDGVYLLIEGSRRRFCCIAAQKICLYGCYQMIHQLRTSRRLLPLHKHHADSHTERLGFSIWN